MKRINKIHTLVKEYTKNIQRSDLSDKKVGITSVDLAEQTDILRNNVSQDLNQLHRELKLIKIKGKPVRYLDAEQIAVLLGGKIQSKDLLFQSAAELLEAPVQANDQGDPFRSLIGAAGSLSPIIQSAKASILYPPFGLHTLLLGESGTGKSLFAEVMYHYGQTEGVFKEDSAFIRFNCADYATNPQFLMSMLFGTRKGAYTGADEERAGLIEAADGGVLFLDEIHRLPPEGQEMLFHFMDQHTYRRMGETTNERTSKVLIIGATTETVSNHLLTTFLRRIPATIWLPNLEERGAKERLELLEFYSRQEAEKLHSPVEFSRNALFLLSCYPAKGNLGQLRSDLQLTIARAYLETRQNNSSRVHVTSKMLPTYIVQRKEALSQEKRNLVEKLLPTDKLVIYPTPKEKPSDQLVIEHDFVNYYLNQLLTSKGSVDLEQLFHEYTLEISKNTLYEDSYSVLFDPLTQEISAVLAELLVEEYKLNFEENIYLSLALFIRNIQQSNGKRVNTVFPEDEIHLSDQAVKTAKKMVEIIEKRFNIVCDTNELTVLATIIHTLIEGRQNQEIRFLVVAHGEATATSLANTINHLLNTDIVLGLDMPLTMSPTETVVEIEKVVKSFPSTHSWILFVDMGSLIQLDKQIKQSEDQNFYVMETTDILIILESVRKVLFTSRTAEHIVADIAKMSELQNDKLQRKIKEYLSIRMNRVIYTVCSSGEGVALFLEKIIGDFLRENHIYDVQIIPLNGTQQEVGQLIRSTSQDKEVVSVIGSIEPKNLTSPFLSLNDILMGQGLNQLLYLLGEERAPAQKEHSIEKATQSLVLQLCQETLDKYLMYLSANKITPMLMHFIEELEKQLEENFSNNLLTKLFIHTGCLLERILFKEQPLAITPEDEDWVKTQGRALDVLLQEALKPMEDLLQLSVNLQERYYLIQLLLENFPHLVAKNVLTD
ncbi:sigma 54-interacting transcriptional regulator [Enterococcus sp. AZ072]|uniref:sigma 54-interacting transcriptional regulator n=1 Tax=unclassified Enterococcus TaxID=2608891 RepID=UPI003D2E322B